jgi:orotate phosphoribosyltransferase
MAPLPVANGSRPAAGVQAHGCHRTAAGRPVLLRRRQRWIRTHSGHTVPTIVSGNTPTSTPASSDALCSLLARLSYRSGTFRLASGLESDFYVDVKQTVFTPEGAKLVGELAMDRLTAHGIESVGGMAVGAVPLVSCALVAAATRGAEIDGFFVRKEVKEHGTAQKLDGRFTPGRRIALLEDVVTTGASTLLAIDAVEEAGGKVDLIITVVDREENDGLAALRARGCIVESLASRTRIMAAAKADSEG